MVGCAAGRSVSADGCFEDVGLSRPESSECPSAATSDFSARAHLEPLAVLFFSAECPCTEMLHRKSLMPLPQPPALVITPQAAGARSSRSR